MRRTTLALALLCALPAFAQVYTVQDELTPLTRRQKLVFTGAGVSCVDSATSAATTCTVSTVSPNTPEVMAETNAGQVFSDATEAFVAFEDETSDTDGAYSPVTSRFTVPVGKAGTYRVKATVYPSFYPTSPLSYDVIISLWVNGAHVRNLVRVNGTTPAGFFDQMFSGEDDVLLSEGDYVQIKLYIDNSASMNVPLNPYGTGNYLRLRRVR